MIVQNGADAVTEAKDREIDHDDDPCCEDPNRLLASNGEYVCRNCGTCLGMEIVNVERRSYNADEVKDVTGYSIGGGHVLHLMCDLTIAADPPYYTLTA